MKLMVALGIRNLSPLGHLDPHGDGCFVCGYGSRCEDCVYALSKRGTITLVQYAAYLAASAYPLRDVVCGGQGYHSIPIILVRTALHLSFRGKLQSIYN